MIRIDPACKREIGGFPERIREEITDAAAELDLGKMLSFPLSKPMPILGNGVHELRLKWRGGTFRVIYWLRGGGEIWFIHAFKKKTQQTSQADIKTVNLRIRRIRHETVHG